MKKVRRYQRTQEHEIAIRDLLACGISIPRIASQLGICDRTIRRHYRDLIKELGIKCGTKAYVPSDVERSLVKKMASIGIIQPHISGMLGISIPTLAKYFRRELTVGMIEANLQVAANLYKMATGPIDQRTTLAAAIWWTKARMNWKDTSRLETTGADGGPIQTQHQIVVVLPDNSRGDGDDDEEDADAEDDVDDC